MVTGDVEVVATDITVLNECKPTVLPFEMKSFHKVNIINDTKGYSSKMFHPPLNPGIHIYLL